MSDSEHGRQREERREPGAQEFERAAAQDVDNHAAAAPGEGEGTPAVGHGAAEVIVDAIGAFHVTAKAAVRKEEGHGQVGTVAVILVLFVDDRVQRTAALVDGVVAFTKADQGLVRLQVTGDFYGD